MKTLQNNKGDEKNNKLFWLGIFVVLLTALQKARIEIGPMPLYFVEVLVVVLLLKTSHSTELLWSEDSRRILFLAKFFFLCVIFGEIRGAFSYNFILPAIYQIARYGLGISLLFVLPRLVKTPQQFQVILKAAVLGMLITGSLSIFSSLPPTRSIAKYVFSNPVLNPTVKSVEKAMDFRGSDYAIRGISLIGPATVTGAYLCILWPLGILAYRRIDSNTKWKRLSLLACFVTPLGALATYSRGAWLGVSLITCLLGLFGFSGSRRIIILFAVLVMIIVSHVGLESKFFLVDRIEKRTMATINDPYASGYESSRFLSYTQPFKHLLENPSWLLAGTGSAASKMAERGAIDGSSSGKAMIATHSVFGRAYLDYGLPGVLCHVFLMLSALALILRNWKYTKRTDQEERLTWQILLAVWLGGLLPWWLFGHAAVSTARGSMVLFFIFAIFLTCEQMRLNSQSSS